MSPESQAEKLVRKVVEDFQSKARDDYRDRILERLAFYSGDHEGPMETGIIRLPTGDVPLRSRGKYLPNYYGKAWETGQVCPVYMPFYRRCADLMATLFHRTPQFRPMLQGQEVPEGDRNRCLRLLDEVQIEAQGKLAQRMTHAVSCCVAMPRVYRGKMYLDICTPDQIEVVQDPMNPGVAADCLAVSVRLPDTTDTVLAQEVRRVTWTREPQPDGTDHWGCYYSDQSGRILPNPFFADNVNPYGRLPVVFLYSERPSDTIFPVLDDTLVQAQIACDIGWTHVFTLMRMHGGTGVRTGDNDDMAAGELPIGPLRFMDLPLGATFTWTELKMNLQEEISALTQLLKTSAGLRGIPTDAFDIEGSKVIDALSAASKQMDRLDLMEIREDQEPLWERQMRELWDLLVTVNNYHRPAARIDENIELQVVWSQPEVPTDRQSDAQASDIEIRLGLESPVDLIARRRKIPRQEAAQAYARNLQERDEGVASPTGGQS